MPRLSTACSPLSTRHGIETNGHHRLEDLVRSPRVPEARPRSCRPAIIVPVGGCAGARKSAAAQGIRAGGPAAKHGPQGIGESWTHLAERWRRPAFEDETLPLAISLGRGAVGKAQLDRREGVASAGPAHQRLGNRSPARREPDPPSILTPSAAIRRQGHWLDDCFGVVWERGRARYGNRLVVVGRRPGRESPGPAVSGHRH